MKIRRNTTAFKYTKAIALLNKLLTRIPSEFSPIILAKLFYLISLNTRHEGFHGAIKEFSEECLSKLQEAF